MRPPTAAAAAAPVIDLVSARFKRSTLEAVASMAETTDLVVAVFNCLDLGL